MLGISLVFFCPWSVVRGPWCADAGGLAWARKVEALAESGGGAAERQLRPRTTDKYVRLIGTTIESVARSVGWRNYARLIGVSR